MKFKIQLITFSLLALLFGFFFSQSAFAANFTLSGFVKNNSAVAVSNATIDVFTVGTTTDVVLPTTTDNSGNYSFSFIPSGTYDVKVTPPAGSGYSSAIALSQNISSNTVLNFVLANAGSVVLTGKLLDPHGNGIANASLILTNGSTISIQATTDASGNYSFTVAPGTYNLHSFNSVVGNTTGTSDVPTSFTFSTANFSLTQSTVMNLVLPFKKVSIHVQDPLNNPIANADVYTTQPTSGFSLGPVNGSGTSYSELHTDSSGNVIMYMYPATYDITAVPPSGSNYTSITNQANITADISLTITLVSPVTLSGKIQNQLGNGISNAQLILSSNAGHIQGATDSLGNYSFQTAPGTYYLHSLNSISGTGTGLSDIPLSFSFSTDNFSLTQNTVMNLTLPFKQVSIHIQDSDSNSVPNADVYTTQPISTFSLGPITGTGTSYSELHTDSGGNAVIYLLPATYDITVVPPSGTIYATTTSHNVSVTGNQTLLISLQYNHATPTTTATLSPAADSQENYHNPTTVTLSSIAASGYTVATTYYTIDGGLKQTYSSSFTVSGEGSHTITYWSIDNVGAAETPNIKTFNIHTNQPPTVNPIANATITEGAAYSANGSFTDTDSTSWTATINYGDGSGVQPLPLSGMNFSLSHQYKEEGTYTVTVSVTDNQGATGIGAAIITVNDATPSVDVITVPASVGINTSLTASANFTDSGVLDTHTAKWNWGDGNTTIGTVTETNGSGSVSNTHTYTSAGSFTLTLSVTDDKGVTGTGQVVVAISPSSSGTLSGTNLSGLTYSGANLSNQNISGSNLQNGTFNNTNFQNANLSGVNAPNASFQNANFTSASLTGSTFQGANFTGANMTGANLKGANFQSAIMTSVTWSNTICPDGTNSNNDGGTCKGHGGGL